MKKSKVGRPKKPAKELKKRVTVRVYEKDLRVLLECGFLSIQHFIDWNIKVAYEKQN